MLNSPKYNKILYDLLVGSRWRWLRHLLFILVFAILAVNQVVSNFYDDNPQIINQYIIPLSSIVLLFFLMVAYCNIYILIPRFFLQNKHLLYVLTFSSLIILNIMVHIIIEYVCNQFLGFETGIFSYFHGQYSGFLIVLSDFVIQALLLFGLSMTVFLKHWLTEINQINELEKKKMELAVEELKNQVSPNFLFHILHHMGETAVEEPEKTSSMLLRLSRMLRYQIYDGSEKKVWLVSEMQFVTNYLYLEELLNGKLRFEIQMEGNQSRVMIPPLLFLPVIREAVYNYQQLTGEEPLRIHTVYKTGVLSFSCNYMFENKEFIVVAEKLIERIEMVYQGKHSFNFEMQQDKLYNVFYLNLQL